MRILLLGKHGQLGWELRRTLAPLGPITAVDFEDFDLADPDSLRQRIREAQPEVIVNAAAYTDVDGAETAREKAYAINATAPQVMAEEAKSMGAALIHYSTDYVFDGTKGVPYVEGDIPNPLNVYGASKLAGEQAIQAVGGAFLILRTAWVYSMRGNSFVNKVLQWARQNEVLRIVDDQISNPTWARILAEATAQILAHGQKYRHERIGLYHLAGGGHTSRYEWAKEILRLDPNPEEQTAKEVQRAATDEIPTPARRPLLSALECRKFADEFDLVVPVWTESLELAFDSSEDGLKRERPSS